MREEAGLLERAYKLAAVWDRTRHPHGVMQPFHVWRLFFLCEITGGEAQTGPETSEVAFFAQHELPAELSTRRVLLPQLQRMFEHMRRPELPTEFDQIGQLNLNVEPHCCGWTIMEPDDLMTDIPLPQGLTRVIIVT